MDAINNIFKAYDVRGKVGSELTSDVTHKIGQAFADWLPNEGAVAVGRDMRPDSAELADALIEGLRRQGRNVINIGQVTSDMIYFAVGHFKLAGGAVVTAMDPGYPPALSSVDPRPPVLYVAGDADRKSVV